MALSWARAALGREAAERYGREADERWPAVLAMIEHPDTLVTTSAGRLFDAVAALLGLRGVVSYEAQAAIQLEACADPNGVDGASRRSLGLDDVETRRENGQMVLDPSPLLTGIVAARDRGHPVPVISAGFHAAFGEAVAGLAVELARAEQLETVALSGGVFQNVLLTDIVSRAVVADGLQVLVHERVPPNDGGISVGQAAIVGAL
jgi:hydrogenase maturation protein HypF